MKRIPWPQTISPAAYSIQGGVVHSTTYDDPYFASAGAMNEKEYVYIKGNHLDRRFRESRKITILELGFGLGLNFLSTLDAHAATGGDCVLDYVAFEKHPFERSDLRKCLRESIGAHARVDDVIAKLPPLLSGFHRVMIYPKVMLTLIYGDAAEYIKELEASVDAFFLDGFSPKKNRVMWTPRLFASFRRLAATGATFSTYSSASDVRRGMIHAGFDVGLPKGFGSKRNMLTGTFRGENDSKAKGSIPADLTIVGGGIAGCSLALRAAELGMKVRIIESGQSAMGRGSSNPLPLVRPVISLDFGPRGQFSWYAYLSAMSFYRRLSLSQPIGWHESAGLQIPSSDVEWNKMCEAVDILALQDDVLKCLDDDSDSFSKLNIKHSRALMIGQVGQLRQCQSFILRLLEGSSVEVLTGKTVSKLAMDSGRLGIRQDSSPFQVDGELVLCNPQDIKRLLPDTDLKLQSIRGQSTQVVGHPTSFDFPICGDGYIAQSEDGGVWSSGTFDVGCDSIECRDSDDLKNMARVNDVLKFDGKLPSLTARRAWAGIRYATHDRMPHAGRIRGGVHVLTGYGSRGFTWAPLTAEIVLSDILGLSCPVERSLKKRISPLRF